MCSLSCKEKEAEDVIYKETVSTQKLDPTFAWLDNSDNYYEDNYMDVFYGYFQKTLDEKNIEKAAHVLEVVAHNKASFYSFDDKFIETLNTFLKNHKDDLPIEKLIFVNTYFTLLYEDKGDYKTAISYALKTIKIPVTDYDTCWEVGHAYRDLSYCFSNIGQQDKAIEYNLEALKYFKKIELLSGIASVYATLGTIYSSLNEFLLAEKNFDIAIAYYKKDDDLNNVFNTLTNKIILYEDSENEKLEALVDSTFNYFKSSGYRNPKAKINVYFNKINFLLDENKLQEAKILIDEIEPIVKEINSNFFNEELYVLITEYKIKNNEKIDPENFINVLIPIAIENEDYQQLLIYYTTLKKYALEEKDYKNAFQYEEKLSEVSIALGKNANSNKVIELDKKYQNAEKTKKILLQEKTIAQKNETIALLVFLFLFATIIALIYQLKQKHKNLEIEKNATQNYTKQLLEKTEEERKRIASDLHDSVSHELLSLKNLFKQQPELTNDKIDAIINDIRIISRNLHPIMFDKVGLKESIKQLVERAQSINNLMITCDIDYETQLITTTELQIYRIVQEAVSNIIKYADAIAAKITISESKSKIHIEIKDNGKGFHVKETLESNAAFGLHNIIERSRVIGGETKIFSDKTGTIITIELSKQ
jgi:signal transduction histidine kinase/tetratricopeptide (TPR) repeat protein